MKFAIQICSDLEWESTKGILKVRRAKLQPQPFGEYFTPSAGQHESIFYQSGTTKTKAAAACQYAIDTWHPDAIVNLGTCGGVSSRVQKLDLIMANRTVQYDCIIRFGEKRKLFHSQMTSSIDTSWVDLGKVTEKPRKGTIATADQDLNHEWRKILQKRNVLGTDWESGAIAKVCKLNNVKCLILTGVSDIPEGHASSEQDTQAADFDRNTPLIMERLLQVISQIRFKDNKR